MGISITKRIKKIAVEAKDRAVNVAKLLNPPYFMVVLQPKNINYGSMVSFSIQQTLNETVSKNLIC